MNEKKLKFHRNKIPLAVVFIAGFSALTRKSGTWLNRCQWRPRLLRIAKGRLPPPSIDTALFSRSCTMLVTFTAGNSVGRVRARLLGRPAYPDCGRTRGPGGTDVGRRSELMDTRPVHPATEGNESAHRVPGHSVDTVVQQQYAQD